MIIRNCTKEVYLESQDVRLDQVVERTSWGQCPNCDVPHPGICPCAWCDQLGHIAQDCMAHFADSSMRTRFPKKEKTPRMPIKHYECHHCGETHPFNIYCSTVRDPPVIPGECRSCGTTTKEHANDCQYVAIKDKYWTVHLLSGPGPSICHMSTMKSGPGGSDEGKEKE